VDIDLVDQVIKAVEYLARFLNWLATRYEQVDCYCVVGNHGRLGRRGEFSPLNNFDYLVYRILEERLRETRAIRWTIPRTWWHVATIQGWRFLMLHGEDVLYNALGIPFYATRRMKTNYRELFELIKRVEGLKDAGFDFMAVGHHHEPAEFYGILMNGSWPGASEFSLKRLQAGGMPSQKIWGVHRDFGITWKRDVNLRPLRRPGAGQGS
jgi:DNA repair exonuclease SbcCD nuclease subunit